jgi:hypothetical protein
MRKGGNFMHEKLKLQVTTVTNAGKEPEKETNALPMALAIVAAFSETSVETEGILSRYLDGCRKLVKRPVFKAYCRNCGIDVGLRQEIVVMLTQDDETELIENTASILARMEDPQKILALKYAFRVLSKRTLLDVSEYQDMELTRMKLA